MRNSTWEAVARLALWLRRRTGTLAVLIILLDSQAFKSHTPGIVVDHLPPVFSYRTGDVTANISGRLLFPVSEIRYQVNGDRWHVARQEGPRVRKPLFCIEIDPRELLSGRNTVQIAAWSKFGGTIRLLRDFHYNPAPVRLPLEVTWTSLRDLEVESGIWETIGAGSGGRLRPKPGFEDYDRIVVATGAFPGGRRVSTEVVFRSCASRRQPFGFGVLPLWGGRRDDGAYSPRRGWNFGLAWYYSHYKGVGAEFSWKKGKEAPRWVASYRDFELEPGVPYRIIVEVRDLLDPGGKHRKYHQRVQWRKQSDGDGPWIEVSDDQGAPLPPGEYAVALMAHRCQVEFGPVLVEPLPPERPPTGN